MWLFRIFLWFSSLAKKPWYCYRLYRAGISKEMHKGGSSHFPEARRSLWGVGAADTESEDLEWEGYCYTGMSMDASRGEKAVRGC